MIEEYSCACGKTGRHDHGKRFVFPIEGRLTTVGGEFEIRRSERGSPTWVAYPLGSTRKERRRLDVRRRKALRKRSPKGSPTSAGQRFSSSYVEGRSSRGSAASGGQR